MAEGQKKTLSILLAVVCLATAGFIVYKTFFSSSYPAPEKQLLKCTSCGEVVEMSMNEFNKKWDELRAKTSPVAPAVFECPKCGKRALMPAKKCQKCGEIFNLQTKLDDYVDRCPKCGYSRTEEIRKSQQ